jgi:threonine dehydrogenase-like Zn-dependent dehydrogenase
MKPYGSNCPSLTTNQQNLKSKNSFMQSQGSISEAHPRRMTAVRLHGRGFENLHVDEVGLPSPSDYQLLARVDAAGVCASNLKLIEQGSAHPFLNGWDLSRFPIQLGDEGCITIVSVGNKLKDRFRIGNRYCIQPAVDHPPINHRERYHQNGEGMLKVAVGYTLPGHLAQYLLITEETIAAGCLLPLPNSRLPFFAAALAEPISCVISAQDRHVHIRQESPASPRRPKLGLLERGVTMIVGAGPMGRMHAEAALRFCPRHLIVVDITESRLAWVRTMLMDRSQTMGIELHAVTADAGPELLRHVSNGRGADDIIVAVGSRAVQIQAQQWLAKGGVLNLFGGLKRGEHIIDLDTIRVHYDDIRICGSSGGAPSDIAETLRMIATGQIDAGQHLAAVGSLDQLPSALEMVKNTKTDGKIVLYPQIRHAPLMQVKNWKRSDEEAFLKEYV